MLFGFYFLIVLTAGILNFNSESLTLEELKVFFEVLIHQMCVVVENCENSVNCS